MNVGGSNNTLTVKGTCASVSIGGADNKITFDKIDKEISVVGLNNTVTYVERRPEVERPRFGKLDQEGLGARAVAPRAVGESLCPGQ